jgi:hypothetical protein
VGWLVALAVAVVGFISSPVWGPPICRAIGVCGDEPASTTGPGPSLPGFGDPAAVFLSLTGGPAGSIVRVSGTGFQPGETVTIRFHTDQVASTVASESGAFTSVEITVPASYGAFAGVQFNVFASGESSIKSAQAPFTVSG